MPKRQKAWQDLKDLQKCPSKFCMLLRLRLEVSIFHDLPMHWIKVHYRQDWCMHRSWCWCPPRPAGTNLNWGKMPFAMCYHTSIRSIRVICRFSAFLELNSFGLHEVEFCARFSTSACNLWQTICDCSWWLSQTWSKNVFFDFGVPQLRIFVSYKVATVHLFWSHWTVTSVLPTVCPVLVWKLYIVQVVHAMEQGRASTIVQSHPGRRGGECCTCYAVTSSQSNNVFSVFLFTGTLSGLSSSFPSSQIVPFVSPCLRTQIVWDAAPAS